MRKEDFQNQLRAASFSALRAGQDYIKNRLSMNLRYVLILNDSCDEGCEEDAKLYPEDDWKVISCKHEDEVVDHIFREDRCPQWIDVSVAGVDKKSTLLSLTCCGRYHSEESRMYYYKRGTQPFGIKSPRLPLNYKKGMKFKLKKPEEAIQSFIEEREKSMKWVANQSSEVVRQR